ncbi:MAG: hypothetical protein IT323_00615 [Anaerolineae bacterium]|nr:hypothetical protein [Anaerolineae bacterium]
MKATKAVHYFLTQVDSLDTLPRETAAAIRAHMQGQSLDGLIVIPPQEYPVMRSMKLLHLPFMWRVTPKRTLAFGERDLMCVSVDSQGRMATHVMPLASITSLEIATVLLYAWAQFAWADGGQVQTLKIEFNAVGEHLLRRKMAALRDAAFTVQPALVAPDPRAEQIVGDMPLKFRNYLRYALLKDEPVRAAFYQPAFRRGDSRLRPYLAPNRAIALTDRAVVLVEEDVAGHTTYGVITRYLPLDKIADVRFEQDEACIWLSLAVGEGGVTQTVRLPLQTARAHVLEAALAPLAEPGQVAMSA